MRRRLATSSVLLGLMCSIAATVESAEPDKANVKVTVATWEQTQQHLAKYRGKVVVLDLWSTSCIPCMREFPNLVELQKKYGDKIVCVSFNCDYIGIKSKPPESYRERAEKFLTKREAKMLNILSSTPSDELFEKIDLASIPAVCVYDQNGNMVNRFDNDEGKYGEEFTYKKHIIPMVEKLLADR